MSMINPRTGYDTMQEQDPGIFLCKETGLVAYTELSLIERAQAEIPGHLQENFGFWQSKVWYCPVFMSVEPFYLLPEFEENGPNWKWSIVKIEPNGYYETLDEKDYGQYQDALKSFFFHIGKSAEDDNESSSNIGDEKGLDGTGDDTSVPLQD